MPRAKKRADGRYARQIYLGLDPITGKRRYKTIYAPSAKEADRLAAEYRAALCRGLDPHAGPRTVRDLLDNLLTVKRAKGDGEAWLEVVEQRCADLAPLWDMPAEKVRASDVQQTLMAAAERGLAHSTLVKTAAIIKEAFALAIPEIVQYNPCDKVVVPAGKPAQPREWLDEERQAWVRNTPHRAQRAAMLMMYSGLRRGEATALTWADVDLDQRTIRVNKSWDFTTGQIKAPKTAAGERLVHIPQLLAEYLRSERAADPSTLYVIHNARGGRMTKQAWRVMWDSYMRDLNVRYGFRMESCKYSARKKDAAGQEQGALPMVIRTFTPHELRHTFCTLMYFAGVDVLTARDQMGHSDIKVTMGIYTHLDKIYKVNKMNALDTYLGQHAVGK